MGQTLRYVELASPIMNTESMPLKHDHQQYADHPAAATTRTTLVTRAIVVMCGVAAVVAGVTYLSTGVVYPRSPVVTHHRDRSPEDVLSGAAGGVLRKGSTTTITLAAFMARYPELLDRSPADQTVQYRAYVSYANGMSVDDLDASYHTRDDGQQEGGGGGGAGAMDAFSCCKDNRMSSGCRFTSGYSSRTCWGYRVLDGSPPCPDQKYECEFAGSGINSLCCRTFPDNRVGSKFWVWEPCT